jgi:cytochrome P450
MTVTTGRSAASEPHFDPYDASFIDDPYPTYRRLRDEAPVFRAEMGFWVVTRYDDVMESLRDARGSREHWRLNQQYLQSHAGASDEWNHFVRDQVQFLDPPSHTRQRKLVSKAFTPRAIEDRRPVVQRLVDDIVDRALERGSMEVIAELARPLPYRVICELLGLPVDDPRIESGWITAIVRGLSTIVTEDDMRAASDALVAITEIVGETIEARRSAPESDLLSGLIAAEEQGDVLTDHEVLSLVINLFVGGSETTMNLIGSGLYSLVRFPEQLERFRADPSLGKNAVEEMLRFESPAQFQSRTTLTEVELSGVTVPANSTLFLCLGSANHDERRWERPDELDIGRADLQHLAFGYGIHHCLGASLARLEASVAIGTVVARLDDIEVTGTPQWGGGAALTQRGLRSLPITFRAR